MLDDTRSRPERVIVDGLSLAEREAQFDREPNRSECALGVFVWRGAKDVSYFSVAQKLQASQGAARGGGGRGAVMDAMTHDRAMATLKGAVSRSQALRVFGSGGQVDLSEAQHPEVIQLHMQGRDLDGVIDGIRHTGAKPLYVETIRTNPGALSFRTYRGTFGDIPPEKIPQTYVRVFVDNPTPHQSVELEQQFNVLFPGPVVQSWSPITEEHPGFLCFRISGSDTEFDSFFRTELEELLARQFAMHSRYPTTQQSKPGAEDSQPQVQGDVWGMHNGDMVNAFSIKQRLRDPKIHHYERLFFERYGKPGVRPQKFAYRHIPGVDSAVVPRIHAYLWDCCKRHGIDPLVISFFEHPPSISQIEVMPERDRHFFALARLAFPELSYQGSAATIVGTHDTIRITPDRTRVVWAARDREGNVYVASNGGAITHACAPEDLVDIRPVHAGKIMDIDLKTGKLVNRGLEFHLPGTDGSAPNSIFIPGAGFDATRLHELDMTRASPHPAKSVLEGKERLKIPSTLSAAFGIYGFKGVDVDRLVTYGNTGSYEAIGLGNADPDGVMGRATSAAELTSEHKAFISSPGRDYRIEFSGRVLLANGEEEPLFLSGPVLVGSRILAGDAGGKELMEQIAKQCGTICVDALKHAKRLRAAYTPDQTLEQALKRLAGDAVAAAQEEGVVHLILDDSISGDEIPIPPDLACAVVHHALSAAPTSESLRSRVNIIADFSGIRNAEEVKECLLHGANAVCPRLAFDASLGLFTEELDGHLTARREQLFKQGVNAVLGFNEDLAIALGSSGFHDIMTLVGSAPGVEHETGIAPDLNQLLGNLPGIKIGGVDLKTLDLFARSRLAQFAGRSTMHRTELLRYEERWERWATPVRQLIKAMATQGAGFVFNASDYTAIPVVTLEDLVQVKEFEGFTDFPDEALRDINLRVLDFVAASIGHMSIGANNVETWLAMLAAVYEIRHEAQAGEIPFLREDEALISAGIGEGGIVADFRMFLMHICGQYASGRFGLATNDGDIFDREQLMKEGLLRIKGIQEGTFDEEEIGMLEGLAAKLIRSEYILADLAALEDGTLKLLCRFISVVNDKNAQDAKRGYAGMLSKTIFLIAAIRGVTPHDAIKSFFNHPDGDSIEELRERIFVLLREASGEIPELGDIELCLWSKAANDPYVIANRFGEVKAGAVSTDLDWRGGTGNRPVGTKRSSHPWIAEAARLDALERDMLGMMTVNWASSNRTPLDWFKKALEGPVDAAMIASSLLGAMGCVFGTCRNCHTGICSPTLTDQREPRRAKLRLFDSELPDDPASKEDNVKTKMERAKRFLLAFMRMQKVLMKNVGARTVEELKRKRGVLEIKERVEVEGAEWIRAVQGHPYDEATVARACSVSDRLDMAHLIQREPFPEQQIATLLERYLALPTEGVSNPEISRNAFLVIGDVINAFPALSIEQRAIYLEFARTAFERLKESYAAFLSRDQLLERYHGLSHLTDRPHQEFLERLITADRILELLSQFCEDGDEHTLRDLFFSRTRHSTDACLSIKSPRAIVSQQNLFTLDTYSGVQRRVAAALLEHIQTKTSPEPFILEIDDVLTDKDTGILTALGPIAHHFPEEFHRSVERIEIRLKRGVAGHNLGALVNGNYLFGKGQGKGKIKIVVGSSEFPAHVDGSTGMSANGATIEVHGYGSDCLGACASDLDLSIRGAAIKLGMGLKGDSVIYCHETLPSVTGIGMTGNATILTAGARRTDGPRKPMAKPGSVGGDMQGLAKIVLPASLEHIRLAQLLGVGTQAKRLSRLDEKQVTQTLATYYPQYTNGTPPPELTREGWSKIVSSHYYRNLVTSILVFDFYRMREDHTFDEQLESAAGELLEKLGIDDRNPAHRSQLDYLMTRLRAMKDELMRTQSANIGKDNDMVFLKAREMALAFLKTLSVADTMPPSDRPDSEEALDR